MRVSLIVAMDLDGVIGRDNALPWRLSTDLKRFKKLTLGKPIIMGRKTYDSIGKPLPRRRNLVLTRQQGLEIEGCEVVPSLEEALDRAGPCDEVVVIGGSSIYAAALDRVDRVYLTRVQGRFAGDAHFPEVDFHRWVEVEREEVPAGEKDECPHIFQILDRQASQ